MDLFPGFGPWMNRVSGGERTMAAVADFRQAAHESSTREDERCLA